MLKIAICDDDLVIVEHIKEICQRFFWQQERDAQLFCFSSGEDLLRAEQSFDFVLLDVEMPKLDGFMVAKQLRMKEVVPYVIFLTSHIGRMAEGFHVRAFRYLLKPIKVEELHQALQDVIDELQTKQKLTFEEQGDTFVIDMQSIKYIESDKKKKMIHTKNTKYACSLSFEGLMERLPMDCFMVVHKSFLIHFAYVEKLEGMTIYLSTGEQIPISRRKKKEIQEGLRKYIRKYAR